MGVTITRSTLNFLPTKFSHNKYLKCKGENPNIHGSAISDGYRLSVLCKCKYIYLSIQKNKNGNAQLKMTYSFSGETKNCFMTKIHSVPV